MGLCLLLGATAIAFGAADADGGHVDQQAGDGSPCQRHDPRRAELAGQPPCGSLLCAASRADAGQKGDPVHRRRSRERRDRAGFTYLPNVDPKRVGWSQKSYRYLGGGWWAWREEG